LRPNENEAQQTGSKHEPEITIEISDIRRHLSSPFARQLRHNAAVFRSEDGLLCQLASHVSGWNPWAAPMTRPKGKPLELSASRKTS
jgi:hypothetical protein